MLALIKNNPVLNRLDILGQFNEGGWCMLPDGSQVSPAVDGWELRGYYLATIQAADNVPDGYQVVSSSVQIVDGLPKYVNVISPVEPSSYSVPVLACIANLTLSDYDVTGVDTSVGLTMAFVIETGKIWVFFENEMSNMNYSWNVNSTTGTVNVTARELEYFEITAKDENGQPAVNAEISVQIFKVQQ